jgi:hypothetical protein
VADAEQAVGVLEIDVPKRFPFGIDDVATHTQKNRYEIQAIIYLLGPRGEPKCFRTITVGKVAQGRHSHEALKRVREALAAGRLDEAREAYKTRPKQSAPMAFKAQRAPS